MDLVLDPVADGFPESLDWIQFGTVSGRGKKPHVRRERVIAGALMETGVIPDHHVDGVRLARGDL